MIPQMIWGAFAFAKFVSASLRYYWIAAKGYRLQPWNSPYLRWRLETFFGKTAAEADARQFFGLLWSERKRLARFLAWAEERRREQNKARGGRA